MDEFSWGNTRLVVGEGKEKKVIINEDEKFDESMIPLKKFSGMSVQSSSHAILTSSQSTKQRLGKGFQGIRTTLATTANLVHVRVHHLLTRINRAPILATTIVTPT